LSILSYLRTAEHITGHVRYAEAAERLIRDHAYALNVLIPKTNAGPGSGNQSDDEMAFMNFYCLLKYEKDARLRQVYGLAFYHRWLIEQPERNPLFNFIYASSVEGLVFTGDAGDQSLAPTGEWLAESADTLRRFPLDRRNWAFSNGHRTDIVRLPSFIENHTRRGHRHDGMVVPIDERYLDKWNHDPWQLEGSGDGRRLADGASFLLPYYMGLYHKFIEE
jgi:hypothetical protein